MAERLALPFDTRQYRGSKFYETKKVWIEQRDRKPRCGRDCVCGNGCAKARALWMIAM